MRVGLDVGSTTIKCVVLDDRDKLIYSTYERHLSHILEKSEELLRRVAEQRGLIVFTDSDGAGFVIRNFLKGAIPEKYLKHAARAEMSEK